jgi:hypothetical protein
MFAQPTCRRRKAVPGESRMQRLRLDDGLLQAASDAFGFFALPIAVTSATVAFWRTWVQPQGPAAVDEGINWGVATGFVPGTRLSLAFFLDQV